MKVILTTFKRLSLWSLTYHSSERETKESISNSHILSGFFNYYEYYSIPAMHPLNYLQNCNTICMGLEIKKLKEVAASILKRSMQRLLSLTTRLICRKPKLPWII